MIGVIAARGGSKGIVGKNLKTLGGQTLVSRCVNKLLGSESIHTVYVTSDSPEILREAELQGAIPFRRSESLAGDHSSSESAWMELLSCVECLPKYLCFAQVTSPFGLSKQIDEALVSLKESSADSIFSALETRDFFYWEEDGSSDGSLAPVNFDPINRLPRQKIKPKYVENGNFYITKTDAFLRSQCRMSGKCIAYKQSPIESLQIDEPHDLDIATAAITINENL